jgi:tetratricopeptide (TPR) repeat protein
MSQAQLAFPELSDSYISLIESDKRVPATDVLELLARKLGCSTVYLVSGVSEEAVNNLRMILNYAEIALQNGEAPEARRRFAEVLASPDVNVLAELERRARWGHALAQESVGELEAAIKELRDLIAESSPEWDREHWARLHMALTRCLRERGDFTASIEAGEAGLRTLAAAGDDRSEIRIELGVTVLGSYIERGDLVRASQLAERLIQGAEDVGTVRARMAAYWQAAGVAEMRGGYHEGIALTERALALLGEDADERNLSRLRGQYAVLLLRAGPENAERVRDLLTQAKGEMSESSASEIDLAMCLSDLAKAEIALDHPQEALALATEAIDMLGEAPRYAMGGALNALGEAYLRLDRREEAIEVLARAAGYLEEMDVSRQAAQAWTDLAELLGQLGDERRQCEAYRRALACVGVNR